MSVHRFSLIWGVLTVSSTSLFSLANPAAQFCIDSGGTVRIETRGDGGQYGICDLGDNQLCEEWALLRKLCPPQGLKVAGFTSPQQVYCAITGGSLTETQKGCLLPSGSTCDLDALWNGKCDNQGVLQNPALNE